MKAEERAALRKLVEAATPGPWASDGTSVTHRGRSVGDYDVLLDAESKADARFIASARDAVPILLKEVERLAARLECANCGDEMDSNCERCDRDTAWTRLRLRVDALAREQAWDRKAWRGLVEMVRENPEDLRATIAQVVAVAPDADVAEVLRTCTAWGHPRGSFEPKDGAPVTSAEDLTAPIPVAGPEDDLAALWRPPAKPSPGSNVIGAAQVARLTGIPEESITSIEVMPGRTGLQVTYTAPNPFAGAFVISEEPTDV